MLYILREFQANFTALRYSCMHFYSLHIFPSIYFVSACNDGTAGLKLDVYSCMLFSSIRLYKRFNGGLTSISPHPPCQFNNMSVRRSTAFTGNGHDVLTSGAVGKSKVIGRGQRPFPCAIIQDKSVFDYTESRSSLSFQYTCQD